MQFRVAKPDDHGRILQVLCAAFGRDDEAKLVDELMHDESAKPLLSLVADVDGSIVGHALFTTVRICGAAPAVRCSILAPLAVEPATQRAGVGRSLIDHGCEALAQDGTDLVFVLGDPDYYTRCGFEPAMPRGLRAPHVITPEEAWMVRPLRPQVLGTVQGTVVCARSLQPEHYWRE